MSIALLPRLEWEAARAAHRAQVEPEIDPARMENPVESFMWTYYSYRPRELRRYHPGALASLADAPEYLERRGYGTRSEGVGVSEAFIAQRRATLEFVLGLLDATAARTANFGCFGMHEWAMVYQLSNEEIRHSKFPLRIGSAATNALVEEIGVRCTHYDAFRFFTAPAIPLNAIHPIREDQPKNEQPGCIHANMDLYKWAYKLAPIIPSSMVLAYFQNARELREIDMRASPYDLVDIGYEPILMETSEGRAEYARIQRELAQQTAPLRAEFAGYIRKVLETFTSSVQ